MAGFSFEVINPCGEGKQIRCTAVYANHRLITRKASNGGGGGSEEGCGGGLLVTSERRATRLLLQVVSTRFFGRYIVFLCSSLSLFWSDVVI